VTVADPKRESTVAALPSQSYSFATRVTQHNNIHSATRQQLLLFQQLQLALCNQATRKSIYACDKKTHGNSVQNAGFLAISDKLRSTDLPGQS
jgi:hypothetical protein